jgi:hypothetical protein
MVEVPPPLDKRQLNKYTRFLARKLMDGMTGSWRVAAAEDRAAPRRDGPGATQPDAALRRDPGEARDAAPAPTPGRRDEPPPTEEDK